MSKLFLMTGVFAILSMNAYSMESKSGNDYVDGDGYYKKFVDSSVKSIGESVVTHTKKVDLVAKSKLTRLSIWQERLMKELGEDQYSFSELPNLSVSGK